MVNENIQNNQLIRADNEVVSSLSEMSGLVAKNIESLTVEIRTGNQMIKDGLNNDLEYKKIDEEIKALQKKRKEIKERAMAAQNLIAIHEKVKTLQKQRKERKASLSDYLIEFERLTGNNQIELFDMKKYEIQKSAKLRKLKEVRIRK